MSATSRRLGMLLGAIVLAGVAIRLGLLLQWPGRLNVDEATVGLMVLHILRGEFPVFFPGHAYMGALEAYLATPFVLAFGPSPGVLKLPVFGASCLFVPVTFLLGRRVAGPRGGLLAALLAAVAPPVLPVFGNYAMLGYVETAVVGSLVLALTLDLAVAAPGGAWRARKLGTLATLAGLGWWLNPMALSYLAAVALVLARSPAARRTPAPWVAPLGFVVGSLPYWAFNLTHAFRSFSMFEKGAGGEVEAGVRKALHLALRIAGVRGLLADPVPLFSAAAGVVTLGLLAVLLVETARWSAWRRGVGLLGLFAACHLLAFSLSSYAESAVERYLFPLYSALPVLAGLGVLALGRGSRALAAGALAVLLVNNVWALARTASAYEAGRRADRREAAPLAALLVADGLDRVYAHQRIAYRLTFETGERVVAMDPFFAERYPEYLEQVDAAPRVAYVLSPVLEPTTAQAEAALRAIGATYRRRDVGDLTILSDFRPPAGGALAGIPPRGWRAEAHPAGSDPARAFDRDPDTAWLSRAALAPGMAYHLDLVEALPVAGVILVPVHPRRGVPRGFRVEVSRDGVVWEAVAAVPDFAVTLRWRDGQPRPDRSGEIVSRFAPRPARYLRIVQTGERRDDWWAIAEIFVYAEAAGPPAGRAPAAAHLRTGLALERARQWAGALAAYARAARLDPEWDEPYARTVEVYRRAGVPLDGTDPYRRGLAFEALGLWANAARQYEAGLRDGAAPAPAAELERRLREARRREGARE